MRLNLRSKIIFIAVAILLVTIGVNTLISMRVFTKNYSDALKSRAFVIGKSVNLQLNRLLKLGIPIADLLGFEDQCQDVLKKYDYISYAMVVDLNGEILFHNTPSQHGKLLTNSAILEAVKRSNESVQTVLQEGKEYYDFIIPVFDMRNKHVAAVRLGFPKEYISQKTTELIYYSIVVAAVSLIFAIFLFVFVFSLWVTKPLGKLLAVIQEMRKEKTGFSKRVEVESRDEIGILAASFNEMTEELQKTTVSRNYVDNIINNMMDSLIVVTAEGTIQTVNRATCDLLGYQPEELIDQPIDKIFEEEEEEEEMQKLFHGTGLQELIKRGFIKGIERTYLTKTGGKVPVLFSGSIMRDNDGNIQGIICLASDISERKRAEEALHKAHAELETRVKERTAELAEANKQLKQQIKAHKQTMQALRESQEQYQILIKTIPHGIQEIDPSGIITFSNLSHSKIYGYGDGEMLGTSILDMQISESAREDLSAYLKTLVKEQPKPTPYIVENITKEGKIIWVQIDWNYKRDNQGRVTGFISIVTDITERKQVEEAIHESEERYRTLIENIPIGIYRNTPGPEGKFLMVNPTYLKMFGFESEEELKKFCVADRAMDPSKRAEFSDNLLTKGSIKGVEFLCKKKDGTPLLGSFTNKVVYDEKGEAVYFDGIVEDITERKKMEEALQKAHDELEQRVKERTAELAASVDNLKEAELRYRTVADLTYDWEYWENPDGTLRYVSPSCERITGYRAEEFLDNPSLFQEIILPDDMNIWSKHHHDASEELKLRETQFHILTRDGNIRWIEHVCRPVTDDRGGFMGFRASNRDITDRKRAEEALKKSEERYRTLFHELADPVAIFREKEPNTFLDCNKAMVLKYGYSREELSKMIPQDLHPPEMLERVILNIQSDEFLPHEYVHIGKDGKYYNVDIHSRKIKYKGEDAQLSIIRDTTQRKWTEEALRRANEKLLKEYNQRKLLSKRLIDLQEKERHQVAMELHDQVGQTLTMLKMELETIPKQCQPMDSVIEDRINVVKDMVLKTMKDVKDIAYGLTPEMLNSLGLMTSLYSLFNDIKKNTAIEINFFTKKIPKKFDKERTLTIFRVVQEGLNNIVKHAQAKKVFINLVRIDKTLSLSIEDNGIGFETEKVMKIRKHKGPLGLFIMRERIEKFNGEFYIESRKDVGTNLMVEIPL